MARLRLFRFLPFAFAVMQACSTGPEPDKLPPVTKDFCSSIHRDTSTSLSRELEPFAEQMRSRTGAYVLEDGGTALLARAWLSEYAEKTIDIQYFIFSTDNVGLIACDYLVRAADRGVKVRILVDDIMVDAGPHELLSLDAHPNIEIRIYNPCANVGKNIASKLKNLGADFQGFNQRMHNKTFTVDGKVVITGGRNIADEYFDYDHEYNFRDRDVLLIGKAVNDVERSFEAYWSDKLSVPVTALVQDTAVEPDAGKRYARLHQYACDPGNFWPQVREQMKKLPEAFHSIVKSGELEWLDSLYFIADKPGKNADRIIPVSGITTDSLFSLVKNARSSVDIQSPYLITTDKGKNLLAYAVKRGVKVRILTNSLASTDNLEAFSGYQRDRTALLRTGARIFEFRPDAKVRYQVMSGALQKKLGYAPVFGLHAKSMVIDGCITVIGTFNFDPRSANFNCECVTVIYSRALAQRVLSGMNTEFLPENSWETTTAFNPDALAGTGKNIKVMTKRIVPKEIL
jgi:phosphatidylserine/phosphatidylglycerophosphate/cardiolipin synthase-like enzyme